ncbi:MAG: hypothetical protein ABGX16_20405 [Pirellulales bacterium]
MLLPRLSSLPAFRQKPIFFATRLLLTLACVCGPHRLTLSATVPDKLRQPNVVNFKPLFCRFTPVPEKYANTKSGYTAFVGGPDGKIYLGTANYYDYGLWLAYDPADRSLTPVVDMREKIGEHRFDINTQSKTHSQLAVGPDGRIWGGTKQGHELFTTRPEIGEQSGGYPGGHLVSYDPATGVARDHGVLRNQDGLMNGIVDQERRRIYFKTEPRTHFLIYEIDSNQVIDKGRVGTWSRYIDMDDKGDVWIPNHQRMTKYDADKDELMEFEVHVEGAGSPYEKPYACVIGGGGIKRGADFNQRGMKLYGGDLRNIQEFDLARAADGVVPMRYVCRSVPEPYEEATDVHTMIQDAKGRIYWTADVKGDPKQLLIMRYDPATEASECLGYTVDGEWDQHENSKNGIGSIQGSAIGTDGTLFIMGTYPYYVLEYPQLTVD